MTTLLLWGVLMQQPAPLSLPLHTAVRVSTDTRGRVTGSLVEILPTEIAVDTDAGVVRVPWADVARVERRAATHDFRDGLLAGAAFGLALSAVTVKGNRALALPVFTLAWGGIGAAGGLFAKAFNPSYEVVYRREPPTFASLLITDLTSLLIQRFQAHPRYCS